MDYQKVIDVALSYADRASSVPIVSNMDNFLRVVESRVNRALLTQKMSSTAYTLIDTTTKYPNRYTLPDDFLSERSIRITQKELLTYSSTLSLVNPEQMANLRNNNSAYAAYCIISGYIEIWPVPVNTDTSTYILEINYFRSVPALTKSAVNNWLSNNNPDCYIFGLLTEINSFAKDGESAALWDARFKQSLDEITLLNDRATWSGNPIYTKVG
jgi:hypothetical protein